MHTSSLEFDARTRLSAAAFTFSRFSRIDPELSTTIPMATGMSSCRNEVMVWGCPFSKTLKTPLSEVSCGFWAEFGALCPAEEAAGAVLAGADGGVDWGFAGPASGAGDA